MPVLAQPGPQLLNVTLYLKLCVFSHIPRSWCELFGLGDAMPPFGLAYTKGWRRCTTLLCLLCGIREMELDLTVLPKVFKARFYQRIEDIRYVSLGAYSHVSKGNLDRFYLLLYITTGTIPASLVDDPSIFSCFPVIVLN